MFCFSVPLSNNTYRILVTGAEDGTLTCSRYNMVENVITRESMQSVKLRVAIRALAFVQNVSGPKPKPITTHAHAHAQPLTHDPQQNLAVAFANGTVALYTCPELTLVRNLALPKDRGAVCALCACRGGRAVAVAEDTGRAYTVATGAGAHRSVRLECDAAAEGRARPLQFVEDPQQRYLCVLTAAGALHIFAQDAVDAAANGQRVAAHVLAGVGVNPEAEESETSETSGAMRAAFNADGTVLAVPAGARVTLLDVAGDDPDAWQRRVLDPPNAVRLCAWSGDGTQLALCSGACGAAVRFWSVAAGAETGALALSDEGDAATAKTTAAVDVRWSPVLDAVAVALRSNECVLAAGAPGPAGEPARKRRRRSVLMELAPEPPQPKDATKTGTHTTRAMPLSLDDIVKKKKNAMDLMAIDESRKKAEAEAEAAKAAAAKAKAEAEAAATRGREEEEEEEGVHIGAPVVDARGKKRVSWARALVAVHEFEKDGFNQCVPKKSREAFLREMEEEKRLMGAQQTLWLDEKDTMTARIAWAAPAPYTPAPGAPPLPRPATRDCTEAARLHAANATRMSVRYPDLSYVPDSPAEPPVEPPVRAPAPVRRGFWVAPPAVVQHDSAGRATAVNVDVLQQNMGALLRYVQEKKRLQQQQQQQQAAATGPVSSLPPAAVAPPVAPAPVAAPQESAQPKAARPLPAFLMGAIRQQQQQQQQQQQSQFMAPQPQPQPQQPQPMMMAGPQPAYPQPVQAGYPPPAGVPFVPQPQPFYAPVPQPYAPPVPQWQPQPQPYYQPVPGYPPPPVYPQWR